MSLTKKLGGAQCQCCHLKLIKASITTFIIITTSIITASSSPSLACAHRRGLAGRYCQELCFCILQDGSQQHYFLDEYLAVTVFCFGMKTKRSRPYHQQPKPLLCFYHLPSLTRQSHGNISAGIITTTHPVERHREREKTTVKRWEDFVVVAEKRLHEIQPAALHRCRAFERQCGCYQRALSTTFTPLQRHTTSASQGLAKREESGMRPPPSCGGISRGKTSLLSPVLWLLLLCPSFRQAKLV